MLTRSRLRRTGGVRRMLIAVVMTTVVALGLTGCTLVPASWKTAFGAWDEYTVYFDSVAGLYESNDVAVLGMPVGQITEITPSGTRVKVDFAIDKEIAIPADATAAIVNTSIVTTRHIELPVYTGGAKLEPGGTVPHSKSPVEIGTLLDSVDSLVANLSAKESGDQPIADLIDIASGVADGNGERMRDALTALEKAARVGASNAGGIGDIVKSVSDLSATLVTNYPKMKAFSNSVTQVAEMLGDQSVGLQATVANVNDTLENTALFMEGNAGTMSSSFTRLAALAANLSDFSREMVDTIDTAPMMFQNLSNSVSVEQGAWRGQALVDKSLIDNELIAKFCEAINLRKNGCRTGQLTDFGPDLGVFSALLEMTKK